MKTRILTTILALLAIATTVRAQFGGGSGTFDNPYIISTTDHMDYLAEQVNSGTWYEGKYFRLVDDLDYTGKTYTPIGKTGDSFAGHFDGNYKTIKGIQLDRTANADVSAEVGLFGKISGGVIRNLTLSNSTIKARVSVGGIVGCADGGTIRNCHVTNDVTIEVVTVFDHESNQPVFDLGGIIGSTTGDPIQIIGCTSAATLIAPNGSNCIGGIVGFIEPPGGTVEDCACTGTIDFGGTEYVGGIVGRIWDSSTVILTNNYTGGNCTIGAVGVKGSTQGTDAGIDITHLYTVSFNNYVSGAIASQSTMTISGTNYYTAGTPVTLTGLYTFGTPSIDGNSKGTMWNFHAFIDYDNYVEVLPQTNTDETCGTYYQGKNSGGLHHYYAGAGETVYFTLSSSWNSWLTDVYTANGDTLTVAYNDTLTVANNDPYQLYAVYCVTMPADTVFLALAGARGLELLDDDSQEQYYDNHDRIYLNNGVLCNVTIKGRTLYKTGQWNTLCLPFAMADLTGTPLEGADMRTLASSSFANGTLTLNFAKATEIEAGRPYIVRWTSGENIENPVFENVIVSDTLIAETTACVVFRGDYATKRIWSEDRYILYMGENNKLYYPNGEMQINAFRGFFELLNGLTAGDLPSEAKNIMLNFGETTSLNGIKNEEFNNGWYTLEGIKLNGKPTKKGVYIYNSKKVVK